MAAIHQVLQREFHCTVLATFYKHQNQKTSKPESATKENGLNVNFVATTVAIAFAKTINVIKIR
jgi:hypothetical protein